MPPPHQIAISVDEGSKARTEAESVRLICGWLQDHGYIHACQTLLDEAGLQTKDSYQLRKAVRTINKHIEDGSWDSVMHTLGKCQPLSSNRSVHFALLRQQFLECVDSGDQQKALTYLTKKIKPLESEIAKREFHILSYTLTCKSVAEAPELHGWSVTNGRRNLQAYLQRLCAPDSTGPVGCPYVHDHGVMPIRGELDEMMLDAVTLRYLHSNEQQQMKTAKKTTVDSIERISIHSLLRNDVASRNATVRTCARYNIQNATTLTSLAQHGGGVGTSIFGPLSTNGSFASQPSGVTPNKEVAASSASGSVSGSARQPEAGGPSLPRPLLLQPSTAAGGTSTSATVTPVKELQQASLSRRGCGPRDETDANAHGREPRSCCLLPRDQIVVVGCSDGSLVSYPLLFDTPDAAASTTTTVEEVSHAMQGTILSRRHCSRVWAVSSAKTAQRFVSIGGNSMIAWGVSSSQFGDVPAINPIGEAHHQHELFATVVAKDGSFAVTGSKAGDITLWDVGAAAAAALSEQVGGGRDTPLLQRSPSLTATRVGGLTSQNDNSSLALGGLDETLPNSSMNQHRLNVMRFGDSSIVDLVLSNFGTSIFVAYKSGEVKVVDLCVGVVVHSFSTPIHTELTSIDLSASGSFLLCSYRNNSIRVWDVVAGSMLPARLTGHHSSAVAFVRAKFAHHDTTIVAGSENGEVVMWDVTSATNAISVSADVQGHGTVPKTTILGGFNLGSSSSPASNNNNNHDGRMLSDDNSSSSSSSLLRSVTAVPMVQPKINAPLHAAVVHDVKYCSDHDGLLLTCSSDGSIVVSSASA